MAVSYNCLLLRKLCMCENCVLFLPVNILTVSASLVTHYTLPCVLILWWCVNVMMWRIMWSHTLFLVELLSPSVPTLTFHNLTTVIISWQYGSHDPQNGSHNPTCFLVEYKNNTSPSNVSSLICDNTTYVFPWLQSGQRYKFRIYSTANDSWSAPGPWSDLFTDGFDGE